MSTITAPTSSRTPTEAAIRARRRPARYIVPAAVLVGAFGFLAGTAAADVENHRSTTEMDEGRCGRLRHDIALMPAEWPATRVMYAAAERCPD